MNYAGAAAPTAKSFAWSWSKLKNFETCPLRHQQIDLLKNFKEDGSEALEWGDQVHKAAENYLTKGTKLPLGMPVLQSWLDKISLIKYEEKYVEQKLAITKDFTPTGYFDRNVWFRTKADFLGIIEPVALAIDWKTGKIVEEAQQLALMAACVFAHFPRIEKIRTEFVWLKEGPDVSSREDFSRGDMGRMWRNIWPRVDALENAYRTNTFPAKPGPLCRKWCVVKSCQHCGI